MPPDSSTRLEIDLELACATICLALLAAQFLHYRPSPLLTHGGSGMLIGGLLNAGLWATSLAMGQPATLSLVVSPMVHDIVYFALIKTMEEAALELRQRWGTRRVAIYHGQLSPEKKKKVYNRFAAAKPQDGLMLLATNAFGMGVDKPYSGGILAFLCQDCVRHSKIADAILAARQLSR